MLDLRELALYGRSLFIGEARHGRLEAYWILGREEYDDNQNLSHSAHFPNLANRGKRLYYTVVRTSRRP